MSDEIRDANFPILMRIQEDAAAFRKEMRDRFDAVEARFEARFDGVDEKLRSQRRDLAGILVMMKSTAGAFDERVEALEQRVKVLERRHS